MKISYAFLFLILSFSAFSQQKTDANVFGHVIDKSTGQHLPFITVFLKGTTVGTTTDGTGHYFIKNLPEGGFTLVSSGLGYSRQEIEVELISDNSLEVNFELEQDAVMLESVVVSSSRQESNRREASTVVNLISPKMLENTNSVCLSQGLSFQPGLRVETNCNVCGFQQLRINGLDGPYSQILIDSRPVFSSLAGIYGLEQIPANMIERVEIIRGGGSALFGANAIAGTVNIITREPTANSFTISNTSNFIHGKTPDINTSFNASVVSDNHKAAAMFFGSGRQRSPYDYNDDGFSNIAKINSGSFGFKGYYQTGIYSKLTAEYHNITEYRRGGNMIDLPPHMADIAEELTHKIHTGGIKFDVYSPDFRHRVSAYSSLQSIDRKSYYGAEQDINAYGQTDDLSLVSGMQYIYSFDNFLFMPSDLTFGAEYNYNNISDKALGYGRILDQTTNIYSIFMQNEWKNRNWSILLGSRIDKHNFIEDPVISPRLNLRYGINDNINLRASYTTGFRAPQAFDEDLHIGTVEGEAVLIRLAPDLRTESSQSISFSADLYKSFGKTITNLLIEGFYTTLGNVFILEEITNPDGSFKLLERRNGDGAIVRGVNIEARIIPSSKLQFQFGGTIQKSEYTEPVSWSENIEPQKKMFRAPDHYGFLTATYDPTRKLSISLSGTYTGSMLVKHYAGYIPEDREVMTPQFFDTNLKVSYEIAINGLTSIQINGGVQNIFDSFQQDLDMGINKDSYYTYGPSMPRTFFAGIRFSL